MWGVSADEKCGIMTSRFLLLPPALPVATVCIVANLTHILGPNCGFGLTCNAMHGEEGVCFNPCDFMLFKGIFLCIDHAVIPLL